MAILIASRILLMPLIAGIAYEIIRFGGRHETTRSSARSWRPAWRCSG